VSNNDRAMQTQPHKQGGSVFSILAKVYYYGVLRTLMAGFLLRPRACSLTCLQCLLVWYTAGGNRITGDDAPQKYPDDQDLQGDNHRCISTPFSEAALGNNLPNRGRAQQRAQLGGCSLRRQQPGPTSRRHTRH
jgi:hypothetical protein